ncbi:MAG: RagB/SusD family nutrient uptake outer membrane protein [Bacteroidota bacterium]
MKRFYSRFIKYYFAIVLFVMGTYSCSNFVDVVPENIAVLDDAFETRDSAERYLATLYGYLPDYSFNGGDPDNPALLAGDEVFLNRGGNRNLWAGPTIAQGGQSRTQTFLGYWGIGGVSNLFIALRDCNIFLDNLDQPFDLLAFERRRWEAEAKFLKAYYHFYLMRMYGPIPIIDENIEVSAGVDAIQVSRRPVDEVTDYIVQLLDEAIEGLPPRITDFGTELGRADATMAAAIKARVLVWAASPLFNGNPDYAGFTDKDGTNLFSTSFDEQKWTVAAEACREAIELAEGQGYRLYRFPNPMPEWSDSTVTKLSIRGSLSERWNDEVLWGATGFGSRVAFQLQSNAQARIVPNLNSSRRQTVASIWSPTLRIAKMFYTENGVPMDEDPSYDEDAIFDRAVADEAHKNYVVEGFETVGLHLNREPRFYASLGFDGGIWFGHGIDDETQSLFPMAKAAEQAGKDDQLRFALSGYFAKKLVYYENVQNAQTGSYSIQSYAWPVIRLADLYLMYAEALNESGQTSMAHEWIDRVRDRAGLDGVVTSWADHSNNPGKPNDQNGLREIIQQERLIELVFEGQRFWDLRRWKLAAEFLNSDIEGWNVDGETYDTFYRVISNGQFRFVAPRDYLWPINEQDIIRNGNLVQNPGW